MGFFDKVKDAAGKGAAKAEDLAKTGKLKFEIMTLNSRIKDKKGLMGEKAYSLFKAGMIAEPQLKEFVDEIEIMLGQIKEKESAIEKLNPKKDGETEPVPFLCKKCKQSVNKGEAFCSNCGSKVE